MSKFFELLQCLKCGGWFKPKESAAYIPICNRCIGGHVLNVRGALVDFRV